MRYRRPCCLDCNVLHARHNFKVSTDNQISVQFLRAAHYHRRRAQRIRDLIAFYRTCVPIGQFANQQLRGFTNQRVLILKRFHWVKTNGRYNFYPTRVRQPKPLRKGAVRTRNAISLLQIQVHTLYCKFDPLVFGAIFCSCVFRSYARVALTVKTLTLLLVSTLPSAR